MRTPRVFLVRHGQTRWTLTGQYTGMTDLSLTEEGQREATASAAVVVGAGKVLDPAQVAHVFVSPLLRARQTYERIFDDATRERLASSGQFEISQDIREWNHGKYEGLLGHEIQARFKAQHPHQERPWNLWVDGCEDGESPADVRERIDNLIAKIRTMQKPCMHGEAPADCVVFGHGNSLRAFAKRWVGFEMGDKLPFLIEPGAMGILSYAHHNIEEPSFTLGINMGKTSH